jgi:hypothetical protein
MAKETTPSPAPVRLLAFDAEDLAVVSATFQDAIVRVADLAFLPRERRFALLAARFDWLAAQRGVLERCWAGLHFDCVRKITHVAVPRGAPGTLLNLLAIDFRPGEAPSGEITLTFSGGAAIRLEVECVEVQMRDTGPRWTARALPGHPVEDTALPEAARQDEASLQRSEGKST